MLSTMRGRGRLPAARKPYTLTPKPQTVAGMPLKIERDARTLRAGTRSCRAQKPYTLTLKPPNSGLHDPKDRARRSHVARGHALLPRADTCCALVFQNIDRQIPELNPPYKQEL